MRRFTFAATRLMLFGFLVSLFLVASGLSQVELKAGNAFPGSTQVAPELGPSDFPPATRLPVKPLIQGFIAVGMCALILIVALRLFMQNDIRQLSRWVLILGALVIVVALLPESSSQASYSPDGGSVLPPPSLEDGESPIGPPPDILEWIVVAALLLGGAMIAAALIRRREKPARVAAALGDEAQVAVQALESGKEIRNIIIRCYARMSHMLQAEKDIARGRAMTAQEFEQALVQKGFPPLPVHQLTSLFEQARYGKMSHDPSLQMEAAECLREIMRFCREGAS